MDIFKGEASERPVRRLVMPGVMAMSGPIEGPNNGYSGHLRPRAYSSIFALCRRLMLATLTGGVAWAQEPAVSRAG